LPALESPSTAALASAPGPSTVLETRSLRHRYGDRVALDGVSFSVTEGEFFAVLGPNGGGKSTLFRILATLTAPQEGDAVLLGASLTREAAVVRRKLGVVFQAPALDRMLTVEENLRAHGNLYGLRGAELKQRVLASAERLGVADRLRERTARLSGGLRRRVEIAKALLPGPRVLLMDEPTTGLDPGARRDLWDHLARMRASDSLTVIFTTHHMDEADRSDRAAILDRGRLLVVDSPARLREGVRGDVVTVSCDNPADLAARIERELHFAATVVAGQVRFETDHGLDAAAQVRSRFPREVRSVTAGKPGLEDVFVNLTGRAFPDDGTEAET